MPAAPDDSTAGPGNAVQYLYDNNHLEDHGDEFADLLDRTEVVVVERNSGGDPEEKEKIERIENAYARGEADRVSGAELDERIEAGEIDLSAYQRFLWSRRDDTDEIEALVHEGDVTMAHEERGAGRIGEWDALRDHSDPPEIVAERANADVMTERMSERYTDVVWSGGAADTPEEGQFKTAATRFRDARVTQQVTELVEEHGHDPGDVGVVMGAQHQADRLVEAEYGATPVNERRFATDSDRDDEAMVALNALRDADGIGYALLGDPAEVAEELGPEVVQAQLAAVGADVLSDSRVANGGFPADYDTNLELALQDADDRSDAEQVARLQSVARKSFAGGYLGGPEPEGPPIVDLDAAEEYGDIDPSPPEDPPESVEDVVTDLLPSDEDGDQRAGVETLVDEGVLPAGRIAPRQLASLKDVAYGERVESGDVVEPLEYDVERAADDLGTQTAETYRAQTRRATLRRGTEATLRWVGERAHELLDATGRLSNALPVGSRNETEESAPTGPEAGSDAATTDPDVGRAGATRSGATTDEPVVDDEPGVESEDEGVVATEERSVNRDRLGSELGAEDSLDRSLKRVLSGSEARSTTDSSMTPTVANAFRQVGDGHERLHDQLRSQAPDRAPSEGRGQEQGSSGESRGPRG